MQEVKNLFLFPSDYSSLCRDLFEPVIVLLSLTVKLNTVEIFEMLSVLYYFYSSSKVNFTPK